MRGFKTALQRVWSWLSPAKSAQLAPTAINPAPAKPGTRELAALHAIRVLRDNAYGITIQEEIRRVARRDLSIGAVYLALEWLEEHGFVTARDGEGTPERGGRKRRYFALTAKGEEALRGS
jgi:PadR family transcriptional regulator, regulatory protein PadR